MRHKKRLLGGQFFSSLTENICILRKIFSGATPPWWRRPQVSRLMWKNGWRGPPGGWLVPIPTYKPSRRVWNKQVTLPKNKKVTINHSTKFQFNSSWFPHKMAKTLVDKVRRIVSQISSLVSFSFLRIFKQLLLGLVYSISRSSSLNGEADQSERNKI